MKVMGKLAEVLEVIGELPVVDKVGGGVGGGDGGRSRRAKATGQAGEVSVDATRWAVEASPPQDRFLL